MRRTFSIAGFTLLCVAVVAAFPLIANAVVNDAALCPGTGVECVVSSHIQIFDPGGIDVRPLTLHITPSGRITATGSPRTPLTIKAGGIIVEKGGGILGTIAAAKGNSLTLLADSFTIDGTVDVSSTRQNGTGGDGGTISATAPGICEIGGTVLANGTKSTSIGGSGGDISFDCGSLDIGKGATIDASGAGFAGMGGNISFAAHATTVTIAKTSTIRAYGYAMDGGSISVSTDGTDASDSCMIAAKLLVDAKAIGSTGGTGGTIDVSCGGDLTLAAGAAFSLNGTDGGGSLGVFSGGSFTLSDRTSIKANGSAGTGGSVDITAGMNTTIAGKVETRAGGLFDNEGSFSITNGRDLLIATSGSVNVSAAHKELQTGQITLVGGTGSGPPHLKIEKGAAITAAGHGAGFGAIDIDISAADCTLGGKIQADSKTENGAAIGFACDTFTMEKTGVIQASSKAGEPGGTAAGALSIDTTAADSGGTPGPCTIDGQVVLKGSSQTVTDPLTSTSFLAAGLGGTVNVLCGQGLSIGDRAVIDVSAGGGQSVGGQATFSSNLPAMIKGTIRAKASGAFSAGGHIAVTAPDVTLAPVVGPLDASAPSGGIIAITATASSGGTGKADIGKTLTTQGGSFGGNVDVRGCDVTVEPSGWLRSDGSTLAGSGGVNEVRAQSNLTIVGKVTAINGHNNFFYSSSMSPTLSGTIKPSAFKDKSLSPCL